LSIIPDRPGALAVSPCGGADAMTGAGLLCGEAAVAAVGAALGLVA
jgi:hypothetical protein